MTDEQIIKALKNYTGFRLAPYDNYIKGDKCILVEDAIDLINRQKEEKEALIAGQKTLQKYIAEQKAEIERLNVEIKAMQNVANSYKLHYETVGAEAINAYHEKVKKRCIEGGIYPAFVERVMSDVRKEMVGDKE